MKTYDLRRVACSLDGIPIDPDAGGGGYGPGDFIEITDKGVSFTDVAGVDGEATRSKNYDKRATIKIHLMQSSRTNDYLAGLELLDRNTDNGAGIGAFLLEDLNGTSQYAAANTWISETPSPKYGQGAQERVWTLRCENLQDFTGGT